MKKRPMENRSTLQLTNDNTLKSSVKFWEPAINI